MNLFRLGWRCLEGFAPYNLGIADLKRRERLKNDERRSGIRTGVKSHPRWHNRKRLEWYDFAIYEYFAVSIGHHFFPHENTIAQLLATFGVFAVGYLARPAQA